MEKRREGSSKKKVMVAIDESQHSYHAFLWALDNLKELLTNSPLVIFAAQPFPNCFDTYGAQLGHSHLYCPGPTSSSLISSVLKQNQDIALGLLERAENICASRGV
ncbi:hypothetical protein Tsubulata_039862 [Turnera subulata]|uniref:UspA domain-containing protein n=1 Tax=Turnera subulata TaxID=218843 RepID=A0A9Q0FCC1_9ROSI|nr:hypothetical protein Tsubulata_039862 [Turnera subulata]